MRNISDREYERRMRRLNERNKQIEMRRKLREAQFKHFPKIKKPNTSKLLVFIVLIINIQILAYVEYVIDKWGDLSALYALIGVPVTIVPTLVSYMHKSQVENTADSGYVYEARMAELKGEEASNAEEIKGEGGTVG